MSALGIYTELVFPQQGNPGATGATGATGAEGPAGADGGYASPSGTAVVNGTTIAVPANKQIHSIAVTAAAGSRTLAVGTSASGTDVIDGEAIPTNTDQNFPVGIFTSTGLTLHFSGFTGTVRVYLL